MGGHLLRGLKDWFIQLTLCFPKIINLRLKYKIEGPNEGPSGRRETETAPSVACSGYSMLSVCSTQVITFTTNGTSRSARTIRGWSVLNQKASSLWPYHPPSKTVHWFYSATHTNEKNLLTHEQDRTLSACTKGTASVIKKKKEEEDSQVCMCAGHSD